MKNETYENLIMQFEGLMSDQKYLITLLSNASALLMDNLDDLNWSGFYLYRDGRLILGPFQGKVACEIIEMGKGVCGTSATKDETVLVRNVHEFPGHIACDSASNSEIVIPLHVNGRLFGVLDIDSPKLERFDETDRKNLEIIARIIEKSIENTDYCK
ncbi:MAG: GAF domain-containing protein [Erysipelotrichaceae bacterium]|nr:GAF domain-containing protein [Erysipelotrichaceae bacterium]